MKTIALTLQNGREIELPVSRDLREVLDMATDNDYSGIFVVSMINGKIDELTEYIPIDEYQKSYKDRIRNFLIWIGKGLGVDLDENDNGTD
jgi:hypothetical protein